MIVEKPPRRSRENLKRLVLHIGGSRDGKSRHRAYLRKDNQTTLGTMSPGKRLETPRAKATAHIGNAMRIPIPEGLSEQYVVVEQLVGIERRTQAAHHDHFTGLLVFRQEFPFGLANPVFGCDCAFKLAQSAKNAALDLGLLGGRIRADMHRNMYVVIAKVAKSCRPDSLKIGLKELLGPINKGINVSNIDTDIKGNKRAHLLDDDLRPFTNAPEIGNLLVG